MDVSRKGIGVVFENLRLYFGVRMKIDSLQICFVWLVIFFVMVNFIYKIRYLVFLEKFKDLIVLGYVFLSNIWS